MKKLTTTLFAAALSGGLCLSGAFAEEKKDEKGGLSAADKQFLMSAQEINLFEIQGGEMAKMKGSTPMVKEMGEKLVKDHTANSDDLKSLASSKNVTLPTEPNVKQKAKGEELNKMEGASFDQAFSEAQAKGHKKAITMFETAAKSSDAEVKAFAEKSLPTLKEHEKMAMSGTGGGDKMHDSKKKKE